MSWKDFIADEREQRLLELAVNRMLDNRAELHLAGDGPGGIDPDLFEAWVMVILCLGRDRGGIAGFGPAEIDGLSGRLLLLTSDQWREMLADMLALRWQDVIGHDRERRLLDTVVGVLLDRWFDGEEHPDLAGDGPEGIDPGKFRKGVRRELDDDWEEGIVAEVGYTPDDYSSLSSRLARLRSDQWLDMLKDMLVACRGAS